MTTKFARQVSTGWSVWFLFAMTMLILLRGAVESSIRLSASLACLAVVASVVAVMKANPHRSISSGSAYALIFGLFHVGLLVPIAVGIPVPLFNSADEQWVTSPGFSTAAVLATIAQCAFSIGYLARHRMELPVTDLIDSSSRDNRFDVIDGVGAVGISLLAVGLVFWIYLALSSGAITLGISYADFLSRTRNANMPITYLMIGLGLGVVSASRHRNVRSLALIIFALWALPAFAIGLRGEAILPASAFAIVAARRGSIRLRPWMGLAAVGVLSAGSAVRVIRQFGLGKGITGIQAFNPFDGIAELGYSIRPLTVVVNFHDRLGEPFVGIATYLAPFRRLIVGRLLGGSVLSVEQDPSVFGGMIAQRIGPIGGSPAAEAYRSGGLVAIVSVMILIGLLVAHLDSMASTPLADAGVAMSSFVLLLWIRNDFTPVPAQFAITALILLLLRLLARRRLRPTYPRNMASKV